MRTAKEWGKDVCAAHGIKYDNFDAVELLAATVERIQAEAFKAGAAAADKAIRNLPIPEMPK